MPSEKIESCSSAPPENMLKSPKTVPCICWKNCRMTSGSIPGVTMNAPMRYTASIANVKRIRCRSSVILPMF